jgi:hypothetical protein
MWSEWLDLGAKWLLNPKMYAGAGMLAIALSVIFVPGIDVSLGWFLCCVFVTLGLMPD